MIGNIKHHQMKPGQPCRGNRWRTTFQAIKFWHCLSILKPVKYAVIASIFLLSTGSHAKMYPGSDFKTRHLNIVFVLSYKYMRDPLFFSCAKSLFYKNTHSGECNKYFDEIVESSKSKLFPTISDVNDIKFRSIIDLSLRAHKDLDQRRILKQNLSQQENVGKYTEV